MIRPTIYSSTFPFRGPKSRTDINNLFNSAKRDFNFCSDYINHVAEKRSNIAKFYLSGFTAEEIKEYLTSYDSNSTNANINTMDGQLNIIKTRAINLLFGSSL